MALYDLVLRLVQPMMFPFLMVRGIYSSMFSYVSNIVFPGRRILTRMLGNTVTPAPILPISTQRDDLSVKVDENPNSTVNLIEIVSKKDDDLDVMVDKNMGSVGIECKNENLVQAMTEESRASIAGKSGSIKEKHPMMNHFVAIPVTDPDVIQQVSSVQQQMLLTGGDMKFPTKRKSNPIDGKVFKKLLVPACKLHFTLHVFHLKDEEDKRKAKSIIGKVWDEFKADFFNRPITVKIQGIDHFNERVIHAKMQGEEEISRLTELSNRLRQEFEAEEIYGETRPLNPHMTIAKLSRSYQLRAMRIRSFPRKMWTPMEHTEFGWQRLTSIHLYSMQERDLTTDSYLSLAEYPVLE